jgi:shikimate 5-dehydrogenase
MAFGLKERGAAVTLTDVDAARAEALAREVGANAIPLSSIAEGGCATAGLSGRASDSAGGARPDKPAVAHAALGERGGSGEPPRAACDILLNCTPIGMHPRIDATPVPASMFRSGMVVYDAIYNPLETRLLREARAAGCRTVAGIDHFVRQAVEQFELWTGRPAPVETMRRVLVEALR